MTIGCAKKTKHTSKKRRDKLVRGFSAIIICILRLWRISAYFVAEPKIALIYLRRILRSVLDHEWLEREQVTSVF